MAVTGRAFSTLVEERVFAPAGMQSSARKHRAQPLRRDLTERLAQAYRTDGDAGPVPAPAGAAQRDGAAGGVVSTVVDLARFDIALDQGRLISAESVALLTTPTPIAAGATAPYGLGFYVQQLDGLKLVWHAGWWEHASSALYLKVPDRNLTFIVLANSEGIWWGNPLDRASVEQSTFARAFLDYFVVPDRRGRR